MIKEHSQGVQQDKMRARMEHEETLQAEMEERMLLEERRRNAADRLGIYCYAQVGSPLSKAIGIAAYEF